MRVEVFENNRERGSGQDIVSESLDLNSLEELYDLVRTKLDDPDVLDVEFTVNLAEKGFVLDVWMGEDSDYEEDYRRDTLHLDPFAFVEEWGRD